MGDDEIDRFFQTRLLSPEIGRLRHRRAPRARLVGLTTFSYLDPDNGTVLFHITIGEHDAWGRGYGTEATELMLGLAFERIGLHRVGLSVFSFNSAPSGRTRRPASAIEGRLREAIIRDGRHWDEVQMGILRDEWLGRRRSRRHGVGWPWRGGR